MPPRPVRGDGVVRRTDLLLVVLHCPISRLPDGRLSFPRKFLDELTMYARFWPGRMRVVAGVEADARSAGGWAPFERAEHRADELPFDVEVRSHDTLTGDLFACSPAVVLAGIGHRYVDLAAWGRDAGVPVVHVTEFTAKTVRQQVWQERVGVLRRLRRLEWAAVQQRRYVRSLRLAAALQCNGTPTYRELAHVNADRLLYFDGRVPEHMLADAADQEARRSRLRDPDSPLRLVFSGRLDRVKGAHLLVDCLRTIRDRGVDAHLTICGEGSLRDEIQDDVRRHGLEHVVTVTGPLSFTDELLPLLRSSMDVFLCPHLQGDPSCTYVEAMACGLPFVSFDNEAAVGVSQASDAMRLSRLGDVTGLAATLVDFVRDPAAVAGASDKALAFASQHTFEATYRKRVAHLRSVAEQWQRPAVHGPDDPPTTRPTRPSDAGRPSQAPTGRRRRIVPRGHRVPLGTRAADRPESGPA